MTEQYDDWGDPIKRYVPRDRSFIGIARSYYHLIVRRYRTLCITILCALCLFWYLSLSREPKVLPIDWSRFAYVQSGACDATSITCTNILSRYVTDSHNLCNAYMVFESLQRYGSKAQRVLLYPEQWDLEEETPTDRNSQLLVRAEKFYKVKLKPVSIIGTDKKTAPGTLNTHSTWSTSITKLKAFEMDDFDRVLHLDSDITLLQSLDELFLLPSTPIAMPRAYWHDGNAQKPPLTSLMMLIEPNAAEYHNFMDILQSWKMKPGFQEGQNYDMDLLNHRFASSAMVLPHRPYAMLSSEFRNKDHSAYLGTINGPRTQHSRYTWDADRALKEAKLIHFSDWPLPKPWVMWPPDGLAELQPDCAGDLRGCRDRVVWKQLYSDFRKRRKELCAILSVPAPDWNDIKNGTQGG